jgi:flagellar biosynthesis/type III secretory pathway protein FliH
MELTKKETEKLKEILIGALFSELEEFILEIKQESFDEGRELGYDEGYNGGVQDSEGF